MGTDLYMYVADDSISSPVISKAFKDEIIYEWYIKYQDFLNKEEIDILIPNQYGEIYLDKKRPITLVERAKILYGLHKATTGKIPDSEIEKINKLRHEISHISEKIEDRERCPIKLKEAFQKIENYLISNSNELPLVHYLYPTKELEYEVYFVVIDGIKKEIQGDLFHYQNYSSLRNKVHIVCEHSPIYIDVKPKIIIDNQTYYTKSVTKAEQYKEQFENFYTFFDLAIKNGKKVLWEFD